MEAIAASRTILVHLNIEVPDDFENATVATVVREVSGAMSVGVNEDDTPILYSGKCVIADAEEL